jgi:hypothetical protein
MKLTRIYAVLMIFLFLNLHFVELSEMVRRHRSRFYKRIRKVSKAEKNKGLFHRKSFTRTLSLKNTVNKVHHGLAFTTPEEDQSSNKITQMIPISTLKSRILNIYSSVIESNIFKYTLGGILFLLEIFVKLPDSDNEIFKFLKEKASMILKFEQFSKDCYNGFKYFYELLTKDDDIDKQFLEQLKKVSEESKKQLLDTYLYYTDYSTVKNYIGKENYQICVDLQKHIKGFGFAYEYWKAQQSPYDVQRMLNMRKFSYKIENNRSEFSMISPEDIPLMINHISEELKTFLNENENNKDLGTLVCEGLFSQISRFICIKFFDFDYFNLNSQQKSDISKQVIVKLKSLKPEEVGLDAVNEYKYREKLIKEFDCNIFPQKYEPEKEGYLSKFLKFFEKITGIIKKGIDLYQKCLQPAYEYVKSKYDEHLEQIEAEKKKIEKEEAENLQKMFNGTPEEFAEGIKRMIELSQAGVISVTPDQMLNVLEHTQNMQNLYNDQVMDQTLQSLNTNTLEQIVEKGFTQSEKEFNELTQELKQEQKTSHQDDDAIARSYFTQELQSIEGADAIRTIMSPQELNAYNANLLRISKEQNALGSTMDFVNKPATYVNNELGKIFEKDIQPELKVITNIVKTEGKAMVKEKLDEYNKDKKKLIRDAGLVGIAISASIVTSPISGSAVAVGIVSSGARYGAKQLIKRSTFEYGKLKAEQSWEKRGMGDKLKAECPILHEYGAALYGETASSLKTVVTDPKGVINGVNKFVSEGVGKQVVKINYKAGEKMFDDRYNKATEGFHPIIKNQIDGGVKILKSEVEKKIGVSTFRFRSRTLKRSRNIQMLKNLIENDITNSAIDIYNDGLAKKIFPVLSTSKTANSIIESLKNVKEIIMALFGKQIIEKVTTFLISVFGGVGLLINFMKIKEIWDLGVTVKNAIYSDDIVERLRLMGRAIGSIIDLITRSPVEYFTNAKNAVGTVLNSTWNLIFGRKRFRRVFRKIRKLKKRRY